MGEFVVVNRYGAQCNNREKAASMSFTKDSLKKLWNSNPAPFMQISFYFSMIINGLGG